MVRSLNLSFDKSGRSSGESLRRERHSGQSELRSKEKRLHG
jgi:hypothetical protein